MLLGDIILASPSYFFSHRSKAVVVSNTHVDAVVVVAAVVVVRATAVNSNCESFNAIHDERLQEVCSRSVI